MKKINRKKGFTIVELVIVIAVIAILAGVLIPTFSNVVNKANQSAAEQSARNAITAGLQMTSNAVLPEGSKIIVDSNKDGKPDYAFNYTGNAMESMKLYNDNNQIVAGIMNSGAKKNDNTYHTFNNILVPTDRISENYYEKTAASPLASAIYYTRTGTGGDNDPYIYTEVKNLTAFTENISYYVKYATLDTVIINSLKVLTNTDTSTYLDDGTIQFKKGTTTYTLSIFNSPDMPLTAFVLVYLG